MSTPVTDKCEESGESLGVVPCAWGVVDMQGWRKTMEDAHVAATDISLPEGDAKVFGVFDGHGGAEVARFCGLYLVSVLTQQEAWKKGKLTTLGDKVKQLSGVDAAESDVGKALRSAFHALDRMVDDVNRREEIALLRTAKPQIGERRDATLIPEPEPSQGLSSQSNSTEPTSGEKCHDKMETDSHGVVASEEAREVSEPDSADDDSTEAVGKEEAAERDQDMMDENDAVDDDANAIVEIDTKRKTKVTTMFQKILSLGSHSGQIVVKVNPEEGSTPPSTEPATTLRQTSHPTLVHNGRMICNLPDHAIHAGATAIVAVLTGRVLTVANAGDSRAVLCRAGGTALALSIDHKPQQDVEKNRITKAGGFVNQFGRVNGNLNLSRSIGDLKYKQVPGIPPPEQIITAEPDIMQVVVEPNDEFLILGCDGIWDCLTNENAVKFVRERIDTKPPTQIGREMLDEIISEDPRVTQGIGGDNMTIMIIDLQPSTRKWRREAPPALPAK